MSTGREIFKEGRARGQRLLLFLFLLFFCFLGSVGSLGIEGL